MKPIQINLTTDQHRGMKQLALDKETTISDLLRKQIDKLLKAKAREQK